MIAAASFLLLAATAANAGPGHSGDHHEMAVGKPGDASHVDRTVEIRMFETEDGEMLFEPSSLEVRRGETIRFTLANDGEVEHEFVLDDPAKNQEHKELMQRFPEMEHDDPNAIRLEPGHRGEIVWTFTNAGTFEFACLIPGHYESGMHAAVQVSGPRLTN
jgi:uncharacterized cupredoxin-like copper-binding protein